MSPDLQTLLEPKPARRPAGRTTKITRVAGE